MTEAELIEIEKRADWLSEDATDEVLSELANSFLESTDWREPVAEIDHRLDAIHRDIYRLVKYVRDLQRFVANPREVPR